MSDEELEEEKEWSVVERNPPSLWRRLKWKLEAIRTFFESIPPFIKRVVAYLPLLWRDRDWDYIFFLEMMRFKIKRMREHMGEHDILLHGKIYQKQMKYAEFLLDRIITNDYCKVEYDLLNHKWGDIQMLEAPCKDHPGSHYVDFTREKCQTPEDKLKEREETMALHHKQDATREKDFDRLFRHIRLYVQRWWD